MSKDYIEEATRKFLTDNDLEINERFISNMDMVYFCESYVLREDNTEALSALKLNRTLSGIDKIEKIKPKTLLEQLKLQGFGWLIYTIGGDVSNVKLKNLSLNVIKQGHMFLTKSDAEREVYFRGLQFEMVEWARANDCLVDVPNNSGGWYNYSMFNCYILTSSTRQFCNVFEDKVQKYYKWECGE